ncbi:MAG: transposase [Patescibacteria group bacterium]|nr:transposase [Patescibacteria group bacterium]
MYYRPSFACEYFYHIYNRGVAKQAIFGDKNDYLRMLSTFSFYLEKDTNKYSLVLKEELNKMLSKMPIQPLVKIYAYCLMPNHFHLILKQVMDKGVSEFMRKTLNSYTRYFNTRNNRIGPIFQGKFKAILIESDEQLLHLTRYIHLNPYVAKLANSVQRYPWSSYKQYLSKNSNRLCTLPELSLIADYQDFVEDYASYAVDLTQIKKFLIDI